MEETGKYNNLSLIVLPLPTSVLQKLQLILLAVNLLTTIFQFILYFFMYMYTFMYVIAYMHFHTWRHAHIC